jgi:hypothetical protein
MIFRIFVAWAADIPYGRKTELGGMMKSAGVFLGGLTSVLACNLMLIGVCSSAPSGPAALPAPPPPAPPAIVKAVPKPAELRVEALPLGVFVWGCGAHRSVDAGGALALPICASLR